MYLVSGVYLVPGGVLSPRGVLSPGGLVPGVWSRGCPLWGVSGPGGRGVSGPGVCMLWGVSAPGGCLLQGGLLWGDVCSWGVWYPSMH